LNVKVILLCLISCTALAGAGSFAHEVEAASSSLYLEDLLLSIKQNTSALAYNVTAVSQCESGGSGPFYSLVGSTNTEYWYNFGIAWNWPHQNPFTPTLGFRAMFEVYSTTSSIFYTSDLMPNIHDGDIVLLSTSLSNGKVTMSVHDWNSSAVDEQSYSAMSATTFVGNLANTADSNGFYTGVLTREFHQATYYGDEESVLYKTSTPLSSAWMRAVEFASPSKSPVAFDNYGSFDYSSPSLLQELHSNGAYLASNATQFQTGSSSNFPKCSTLPLSTILTPVLEVIIIAAVAVAGAVSGTIIFIKRRRPTTAPLPSMPPPPYMQRDC
jgi:hypothetical protein